MSKPDLMKISQHPELAKNAACWFAKKWGIPKEEYEKSMEDCINRKSAVPQWYVVLGEGGRIVAGAGIIENDFHLRKDLAPNLCALFVEEEYRGQGLARHILDFARREAAKMGFSKLYLITDHTSFYEKCGWRFLTMAEEEGGGLARVYEADAIFCDGSDFS